MTAQDPSALSNRRKGSLKRIAVVVAGAALLSASVFAADRLTRKSITINVSGSRIHQLHTHASTVGAALDEARIGLDPEDVVFPSLRTPLTDGMTITVRKARAIAVQADGAVRHVRTQAVHPLEVLREQAIAIGDYDVVQINGQNYTLERLKKTQWDTPVTNIRVVRSKAVKVIEGDTTLVLHTTQADVGRALDAAGVTLYLADRVTPDLSTPVDDGLVVAIERSVPVTVSADGHTIQTRAIGPTVGDALAQIGVAPLGLDYTIPPADVLLEPGMAIQVVRVSEDVITKEESIPFPTITRPADGPPRILQEGVNGLRRWQVSVRYEDGREVASDVVAEWIVQTPVPHIVTQDSPTP